MEIQEVQRLARSINLIRPDWPVPSLETFIRRREHMAPLDLHLQLVYVAHDPKTTTPARIDQHGPWKYLLVGPRNHAGVQYRYPDLRDCRTCGKPQAHPHRGHDYEPAFGVVTNRATPDVIAAVRQAAIESAKPLPKIQPDTQEEAS